MPVEAIPIDSTRAPLANAALADSGGGVSGPRAGSACTAIRLGPAGLDADEQHRPGERRTGLDHVPVAAEQAPERALGEMVEMPRGVTQLAHVGAPGDGPR